MEVVNIRDTVQNRQNYMKKRESILQETIQNPSPPPPAAVSPLSASASPTHEFSFTISLNPKSAQDSHKHGTTYTDYKVDSSSTDRTPPPEPPVTAIDLSPADDIFFHGHLLPLHLISHLPVSPRSSTNSMDSFTLPIRDITKDHHNPVGNTSFHYHQRNTFSDFNLPNTNTNANQTRPKSKSFSIFGARPKSKKESLDHEEDLPNNNNSKKKLKLEVAQLIKRYMKMVRPFMSFPKAKRSNTEVINRQPHSFSGNYLSSTKTNSLPVEMSRGDRKRGKFSAPASMRTSPANSGILASGTISPAISTTSDSTMEELQAAIQAAIAHCKNSIAIEDHKGQA